MRARAISFIINTVTKKSIVDTNALKGDQDEKAAKETIAKCILSQYLKSKDIKENAPTHNIKLPPPTYVGTRKDYVNKTLKPIRFHERANISTYEMKIYEDINESKVEINFLKLMSMFDNEEEINEVDIEKLLKVDYEKLGEYKDKLSSIVEYAKGLDYDDEDDNKKKNEVIDYLNAKLAQIKSNEENIENVIVNIDKVDKIAYGPLVSKVYFNKPK